MGLAPMLAIIVCECSRAKQGDKKGETATPLDIFKRLQFPFNHVLHVIRSKLKTSRLRNCTARSIADQKQDCQNIQNGQSCSRLSAGRVFGPSSNVPVTLSFRCAQLPLGCTVLKIAWTFSIPATSTCIGHFAVIAAVGVVIFAGVCKQAHCCIKAWAQAYSEAECSRYNAQLPVVSSTKSSQSRVV
eukprot:3189-Heterococcus_DN1.PRE.1